MARNVQLNVDVRSNLRRTFQLAQDFNNDLKMERRGELGCKKQVFSPLKGEVWFGVVPSVSFKGCTQGI